MRNDGERRQRDGSEIELRAQAKPLSGSNLERAGDHNQRVVLEAVRLHGPITRPAVAAMTGLTLPTIATITKRLADDGFVSVVGRVRGARGQPAIRLAINPDGAYSLGVNIDRDHVTVVLTDILGQVRDHATLEVSFAAPEAVARFFKARVKAIFTRMPDVVDRLIGVGVAVPDDLGKVQLPHQPDAFRVWQDTNVANLFSAVVDAPVFIENDAAAAAIGELNFGHGVDSQSFFYILINEGLGGGMVLDGAYFRGARGRSGEIGFMPLREGGGTARMLQDDVSLSALYVYLEARGVQASTPAELAKARGKADQLIAGWIDMAADRLIDSVMAVTCLIDPDSIFIGGRLPERWVDRLAARLNMLLEERASQLPSVAPVRRAAMASDASAIGAAMAPFMDRLLPSPKALVKA